MQYISCQSFGFFSFIPKGTCWARHITSVDGFVFFRLSYFDNSDLQLFAIFIFEVDFSEPYLMTSAENSISHSVILGGSGGANPLHPPPRSAPAIPAE